jgi:hypothetical protein
MGQTHKRARIAEASACKNLKRELKFIAPKIKPRAALMTPSRRREKVIYAATLYSSIAISIHEYELARPPKTLSCVSG